MTATFVKIQCGERTGREGSVLTLKGGAFVLGRDEGCSVTVEGDVVSRRHAQLVLKPTGWMVQDLESRNGTFLNGRAVQIAELREGDILMLGEAGPRFRIKGFEAGAVNDDLEATRLLRVPRKRRDATAAPASPPPPKPDQATPEQAKPAGRRFPVFVVIGFVFGVLTGLAVWPAAFPYPQFAAPGLWMTRVFREWWPAVGDHVGLVVTASLGGYWAIVGFAVRRPLRRLSWLMVLVIVHGASVLTISEIDLVTRLNPLPKPEGPRGYEEPAPEPQSPEQQVTALAAVAAQRVREGREVARSAPALSGTDAALAALSERLDEIEAEAGEPLADAAALRSRLRAVARDYANRQLIVMQVRDVARDSVATHKDAVDAVLLQVETLRADIDDPALRTRLDAVAASLQASAEETPGRARALQEAPEYEAARSGRKAFDEHVARVEKALDAIAPKR